jgi:hypothetical protein
MNRLDTLHQCLALAKVLPRWIAFSVVCMLIFIVSIFCIAIQHPLLLGFALGMATLCGLSSVIAFIRVVEILKDKSTLYRRLFEGAKPTEIAVFWDECWSDRQAFLKELAAFCNKDEDFLRAILEGVHMRHRNEKEKWYEGALNDALKPSPCAAESSY